MKYLIIIALLLLSGCKKHRFEYSDGYYEDTFLCALYPTPFYTIVTAHDSDDAKRAFAEWQVRQYKLPVDNIDCVLQNPNNFK